MTDARRSPLHRWGEGVMSIGEDDIAEESFFHIFVQYTEEPSLVATTLLTPSYLDDFVLGYCYSEGIITLEGAKDAKVILDESGGVLVCSGALQPTPFQPRLGATTASCGWCDKLSIEDAISLLKGRRSKSRISMAMESICELPDRMKQSQPLFASTGGVHATAIFDGQGELKYLREDVGRHNAVDKVLGCCLKEGKLPAEYGIMVLSGRAGVELVHKAAMAGVEILVSVGPPTTMAVDLAREANITLIGFTKGSNANVHTHPSRVMKND